MRRPPLPPTSKESPDDWVILKTDSLAERVRKMNLKKQKSMEREGSREKSVPRKADKYVAHIKHTHLDWDFHLAHE